VERRFNEQLREHEDNKFAHSAARHDLTNTWIERFQVPMELKLRELEKRVNVDLEKRISTLEKWRYWIMGGIALIAFEVPVVVAIFHR
jgi:hypothetical protein